MEKKITANRLKKQIYNVVGPMTSHLYRDEDWSGVRSVIASIRKVLNLLSERLDLVVSVEDGGYRENDGAYWKEYRLSVVDLDTQAQVVGGHLNAHGAGTFINPFERYDMTVVLY